ncbi:MAG TPA: META domain-containing protein [Burkholderiaceae bacterium]|nr:META domain-containing protein [Burkholderiaceae bacterium]
MRRPIATALVVIFITGMLGACARLPFRAAAPAPAQQAGVPAPPTAAPAAQPQSTPSSSPSPSPSPSPASSTDEIVGPIWQWTGLLSPAEEMDVYASDRYTIRLLPTGRVELTADCRRGTGRWSATGEQGIAIGPIELGGAPCPPGSLSERFATELPRSSAWLIGDGGELYLELPDGAGVLRFRRLR